MASSSPIKGLTKSKELGRYVEGSGGGKPQQGERTVAVEEVKLAINCASCDKQINKPKIPLVCSCKAEIFCTEDCRLSSSHICQGDLSSSQKSKETCCPGQDKKEGCAYGKIIRKCIESLRLESASDRGPSSDKINKLMARTHGDQEHLLVLAEAGDPIAALIVGEAFALRKTVGEGFTMPRKYLDRSKSETSEIAIKWLKIAAEGGVPEGMFLLALKLEDDYGVVADKRWAHYWLDKAYGTGYMDYLIDILESDGRGLPAELENVSSTIDRLNGNFQSIISPTLSCLLLASRWQELKDWEGKTAMGQPFYGRFFFNAIMENVGWDLEKKDAQLSSLAFSKKKSFTIAFISGRPGCCDITSFVVPKERSENNPKFMQGAKAEFNPDYQLVIQMTENCDLFNKGRTSYLVSCKHNESNIEGHDLLKRKLGLNAIKCGRGTPLDEYQFAGECRDCHRDAIQRLKAVANGQFSISINQVIPLYGYAARYVNDDGVIVQDIFKTYSKPDMRQMLQCLMSNSADLHPAAVAEDQNLYWSIVWYWGSVFRAIEDTCSRSTLEAIYQRLGENITLASSGDASALAAFPESAAGEWRVACGSQDCPRVDHEVKFNVCSGCKVRRYCDEVCQKNDWPKHKQFCKNVKHE